MGIFSALFSLHKKPDLKIKDFSWGRHDEYYEKGCLRIHPYVQLPGGGSKKADRNKIIEGIKYLDAVTKINPENWAAFWVKGKGYQAVGDSESAYEEFKLSFNIRKDNADVARELMIESLNLGYGFEGVKIAKHALTLDPKNAGLMANLGLAYLISGELDKAVDTAQEAIVLDKQDKINKQLLHIIHEVQSGKRSQPSKYSDLMD